MSRLKTKQVKSELQKVERMNSNRNRPLQKGETEEKTLGCRYSRPDICAKHSLPEVCAFVTKDGVCYEPPNSWNKLYKKLSANMENTK